MSHQSEPHANFVRSCSRHMANRRVSPRVEQEPEVALELARFPARLLEKRYSLKFGEFQGWLGCRYCGKWHVAREAFSAAQIKCGVATRHCTRWSHVSTEQLAQRVASGCAGLIPTLNECRLHLRNLDNRRRQLLVGRGDGQGSARAEEALGTQVPAFSTAQEEEDALVLRRARYKVLKLEGNSDGWFSRRSINDAWVDKVMNEDTDAAWLATEMLFLLRAATPEGRSYLEAKGRPVAALVATLEAVVSGDEGDHEWLLPSVNVEWAACVATRLLDFVGRELLEKAGIMNEYRKKKPASSKGMRLVADFRAYSDLEAAMDRSKHNVRIAASRDLMGREGGGWAVVLTNEPQASVAEVAQGRADGWLPLSAREPGIMRDGCLPWRCDEYVPVKQGLPCFLGALLAAVALPSLRALLGGNDVAAGLVGGVSWRWLQGLRERRAAAPVAAVQLREEPVEEWGVLLRTEGVFMLRAWLRKGGEVITHFITFNAGTRVLYLGPWVWLVEEKDLCDLERLAHDIEMRHGIFLNEGSTCRRVWFEPAHAAALQLPYNVPEEVRAVRGALGVGLSKYARKRKRERESESTEEGRV